MSSTPLLRRLGLTALVTLGGLATPSLAQTTIPLNPKAAYLRVNGENPPGTAPIALAPLGVLSGSCLRLRVLGDYDPGPGGDTVTSTFAVFSASATLLAGNVVQRVADAVEAGVDYVTPTTFIGSLPTDIPEDFVVTFTGGLGEVTVQVPAGAAFLFVCAGDHYFTDNSDPDGDYAVELTTVGCWTDLGSGLAGVGGTPVLAGTGTLIGGDPAALELSGAAANTSAALIFGFGLANVPFKGGVMVPSFDVLVTGIPTGSAGEVSIPTLWPVGVPPGVSVYMQFWVLDPTGPQGVTASNGLSATTP